MIQGGYYIKARCIQNSKIAYAPPYIREIWDWLLKEANHNDNGKIHRGQLIRTFHDIIDGLKWFIGYRKMTYTKTQCENAMRWLRKEGMITTMKTTRGLIITICNYDIYQEPKNYESNTSKGTKATRKQQPPDTINKNERIKESKSIYAPFYYLETNLIKYRLSYKKDYINFLKWCLSEAPRTLQLSNPIKLGQFVELRSKFSKQELKKVIMDMQNHKDLLKKYTSAYLTANNWLNRDKQ